MNLLDLDRNLFNFINIDIANIFFDFLMPLLSSKGYYFILPYIAYVLLQDYKEWNSKKGFLFRTSIFAIFVAFFSFILTDWLANELKYFIGRIRPCTTINEVRLLVGCTDSFSMPSNHAANSFAILLPLYYLTRKLVSIWAVSYLIALAFLVSLSRIYVGVHYPSDVIVGAFWGGIVSAFVIFIAKCTILNKKMNIYNAFFIFILFALSIFRIYYIFNGPLDLGPDEAHYWEWSRRLDISYYSKGPMIAYLIYAGTYIFGDNVFGIRIMAVLFSVLSSLFLYKLIKEMYDNVPAAAFGSLLFQVIPLYAPFGIIFSIDAPFIFFWILSLYLFWMAVNKAEPLLSGSNLSKSSPPKLISDYKTWLLIGIVAGLGLMTKYTMAFFFLCGFLFLLFTEKRYLLKTLNPYLALLTALLVFSPVIIWNIQNDWVALRHTAGHAGITEGFSISLKSFSEFLASQIGVVTPVIFLMMMYSLIKRKKSDLQHRFLLYFCIPVIVFFMFKSLQGKVQANWAMHGYITGIIAFTVYYLYPENRILKNWKSAITKKLSIFGIIIALMVTAVSHYPSLINLPVKLDPSSRLRGWSKLGDEVSMIHSSLSKKGDAIIFSDSYQVSSELAFYVKGQPKTFCINLGRRMNQYDLWQDMNSHIKKIKEKKADININAIFVRMGVTDMPPEMTGSFDAFERKVLTVYDKKNNILRQYSIFICYNFKGLETSKPEKF